ncbi:MAG TPA: succinate dehydrogenase cytochrome b subunit [Bacteroidota bacterium]|nr:succinate dehydrogenase cytochrome b subunit [Bacteroidota bacterium]
MTSLAAFYNSSVGKKVLMSLTGLFLCTFLVEHVVGNLLVFKGPEVFNAYSEFMVANPVIRTVEFILFAALFIHPFFGFVVWLQNRRTRPQDYRVYRLKDNTPLAARHTMFTGSVVLFFLVVHLRMFFIPTRFAEVKPSSYALVQEAFSNAWYTGFYIVALVILGYHLRHGFQSAFQTLGLRNKQYAGLIDLVAAVFWLVIPLGFATIPVYFYYFQRLAPAVMAVGAH